MDEIALILGLLATVAALATAARRLRVPSPILMLIGGIAIGFTPGLLDVVLQPELVFLFFLPPLLFVAAFLAPIRDYRSNAGSIGLLAIALVLVTALAVAGFVRLVLPSLGWGAAFVLGAIVAPPDAVAATSILQRIGVPKRLVTILEGESLLNDATALVAYRLAVVAVVSGTFSPGGAVASFLLVGVGGVAIGWLVGVVTMAVRLRVDTPVSITVSILTPFIAYLGAERLGVSGVLAAVTAGLYAGRRISALPSDARVAARAVWQMIEFLLNGLLFLLIGMQLPVIVRDLHDTPVSEAIAVGLGVSVIVVATRFVWVFATAYLPVLVRRHRHDRPAPRAMTIVSWAGLRGGVSLAAALALPLDFPLRDLLIFVTFCVIAVTLVGQGLTLPFLARRLGVVATQDLEHETAHARATVAEAGLAVLPELRARWPGHTELIDRLGAEYEYRTAHEQIHHEDDLGAAERETLEHRQILEELIATERAAAHELHGRRVISDDVLRRIERDLDLSELRASI